MNLKNSSAKIPKILANKLNNKKLSKIYNYFEKSLNINDKFVVAVSGGADSLALSFLAKIYSIKKKLKTKYLIIDHRLRSNSTLEAKNVKKILMSFGIKAEILTWKGKKPSKNIQSIARKKRYELLFLKCRKLNINNILLAHHQDDLFENFFIRILRGSGLKGLVSFKKELKINNMNILRPLLEVKKKDLIFISKFVFNNFVDDPSNYDEKFLRTRVRKILIQLENEGLDDKKFYKSIRNLQYSDKTIQTYIDKNLEENSFFSVKKNRSILSKNFFAQPQEVVFRSLSDLLRIIGKKYYPSRGKKLEKIIQEIQKNTSFRATLGGCIIEKVKQTVIISKER